MDLAGNDSELKQRIKDKFCAGAVETPAQGAAPAPAPAPVESTSQSPISQDKQTALDAAKKAMDEAGDDLEKQKAAQTLLDKANAMGGGGRRSKRRRQKKSSKKSKKGGRSRKNGSKNRRKHSRRR